MSDGRHSPQPTPKDEVMTTAPTPKAIGYIRVSTTRQAESGYGLEAQREQVLSYCAANSLELVGLHVDVMSGRKTDKLYGRIAAVTAIQAGIANVLVVNTLDRSSRSMADGAKLVADAKTEGWRIVGLDGTDSDTVSQLTAHARLLVAEEERELISKRTKQGLIKARQLGKQLGKPSTIERATIDRIVELRSAGKGTKAIAKALDSDGIAAPRSSTWSYSTVRGVLEREGVA
ncbi:recombinase family protein [Mycobacteroides abscessus]|nr:recombinase family protein [Mycobacteroides abscessus]MDM2075548.1 recombinase family protein [Mycobacteroides abscessus]MDM2088674.1 recombinase family protein [Mycobacteroides abscessus]MDM3911598.1 recombinase family protein [Mycobacteroides abscessus]MDM3916108.1 recombinase family protein [Mycobacteroides abscessus]MDM3938606.1 recombinase family protein [Mycobacteroides abscessus]